ncbi:hemoglobin/transferrin/lactoferrin receptor protein [Devosia sp. YR412]|uniref:TonB-dependent receptor domain-containing protein n=1 Tax=Devosia sp. YR412 TaxID=1881030 RepID=UPI0008AA9D9A|nr:TonB-dependent receptor [Devosia sp. YR412]SEQ36942.1 hemoglobin/transferrin/lactoferrin receptor protein [Devosia sp. YR412]
MGLVQSRAVALMCGVALGAVALQGAAAQSNVNTTNVTLLERLVIGAGAPKVAINTPQAVTVVSQADIDQKQASSTGEIFDEIPGVTMVGSERVLGESFNIRGIGAAETSGDEARIAITVDGAKKFYEQYRMGSFFSDPELYKQVEVLRGPASSTLYGAGAMAGVINFTTKDASDFIRDGQTGAIRVKGSYNSNGNGTLVSGLIAHQINETFEILATGNLRQSAVQTLANGGTLPGSEFSAWSGLVKGTMHLDDEQVVRLSYQQWATNALKQDYAQTGTIPLTNPQNFGQIDRNVADKTAVLSYENPASDNDMLDLKVQLSYSDTTVAQRNPTVNIGTIGAADYGYGTTQLNAQNTSKFAGEGWENFLTYGVQASHQVRTAAPVGGGVITTHPEGTSTNVGVFAQSEHTINDALTLIGGARLDYSNLVPSSALTTTTPNSQWAFSPKLAALYAFSDNFNVFGSVAHTERMPTLDEMFQYSGTRTANLNLRKESSDNFELGFGTTAYDLVEDGDSLGFKATGFYNNITDGIRSNPRTANAPYFVNIAGMRIWGVELEGAYESEQMFARLAYTFTRGDYTQPFVGAGGTAATNASNTRNVGDPVDTLPQDKIVATIGGRLPEYDIEFGTKVTLAANPIVAVDTVPASAKPTGWASVDVFASWKPEGGQFKGLEAQFSVENIFDADYRENLSMDRSKGRTFKVTLAKQFDY